MFPLVFWLSCIQRRADGPSSNLILMNPSKFVFYIGFITATAQEIWQENYHLFSHSNGKNFPYTVDSHLFEVSREIEKWFE